VSVLVGWGLGIEPLTRVFPGLIAMKPNAALAFVLSGLALWSIQEGRGVSRWAIGLSTAVASIGGLTLFEYGAGVNLGIDEILHLPGPPNQVAFFPVRMHPTTAFDFLALGLASILLAADRHHRTAQGLALLAAAVAGSTLIGYLYGVRVFVGLAVYHQMALHTTIGMLVLSAGLLLARPRRGLMVAITADGPSGLMARRLLPVAILTPIVVNGLMILASEAGLFEGRYATAIRVTVLIAIFVACIWRIAGSLYRMDQERRRVDSERIEGERRSRFLADSMPQIVWTARPDGFLDYHNRRWYDFTGMTVEQVRQQGWGPVLHPDDLRRCEARWDLAVRTGEKYEIEYRFRRADGAFRWHLGRAEPMRDDCGRIVQWVGTGTDIHDQKTTGERRYRSLVEATAAIVWNTSPTGEFDSEQPAWASFTGQDFEQSRGWGRLGAMHPDDREKTTLAWSKAIADRSVYEVNHRLRRRDGEYRHMLARAVPLLDEDGAIREWIGVHTDIDDQERTHEAMRAAKVAAEAATRAKGEFLANMSHEIRTPMNGVLGMTELALATDLTPRQREYLGLVKQSADALLTVIDDILDFSKIEAGKLTLEPIPFPVRDLVTDTLRALALKAHDKGLELACLIAPDVPESVIGDPGRLRQVLMNLVGNAIKFTEGGEVVVTVEPDLADDAAGVLRFSVADSGIGIPPEKRGSIFAPFEQADGSTTRKYGGTGLGLTISARLIELMDGRIWVEENPGGGSVFRFTARLVGDPEGWAAPLAASPVLLDGLRVLIVDDNRTNRMILEDVLSQWGCRPLAVDSGPEALRALGRAADRGEPYPLVMLDMMMPGMDGCELARRVRADPRHAATRMLMLTSGGPDDSGRARELGIGGWLAKPVRQSELLVAMLNLIGLEGGPPPPAQPEPIPAPPAATGRRLRVLLAEDHPINQKVATRMLESQGHEVTIAANGRLALEDLASSGPFDLILMDVQMPEMDGFEATAAIRSGERPGGVRMPVVALTAHAMTGDRERCLAAGFDDYLAKPIHAAALADVLARASGAGRVGSAEPESPPEERTVFDLEAALVGVGGDEQLLGEILGMFLDEVPRLLADARLAVEADDAQALSRLAHTLVGAAGHLSVPRVTASALRLDAMGKSEDLADADDAIRDFGREFDLFRLAAGDSRLAGGTRADIEPPGIDRTLRMVREPK
jgi:two-component system sensor histidine kinase/response regulator